MSPIQLLIVAEDAHLVERNPALARKIRRDARTPGDAVAHRDDARDLALQPLHRLREGVAQPLDDLEQREVRIGEPAAEQERATAFRDHVVEIAEVFWRATLAKILSAPLRLLFLVLVVEAGA